MQFQKIVDKGSRQVTVKMKKYKLSMQKTVFMHMVSRITTMRMNMQGNLCTVADIELCVHK